MSSRQRYYPTNTLLQGRGSCKLSHVCFIRFTPPLSSPLVPTFQPCDNTDDCCRTGLAAAPGRNVRLYVMSLAGAALVPPYAGSCGQHSK